MRLVTLSLASEADRHVLRIQDDGQGLVTSERHDGLGLKIMQYRARRMGGAFDIQAGPSGGTVVTVSFSSTPKPS
jgi:signal transduction histidine kinase